MIFYLGLASIFLSLVSGEMQPDFKYEGGAFVLKTFRGNLAITVHEGGNITCESVTGTGSKYQRWVFLDHGASEDPAVFELKQQEVGYNIFSGLTAEAEPKQIEVDYEGHKGPGGVAVHQLKIGGRCLQNEGEGRPMFLDDCQDGITDRRELWRVERTQEGRFF